MNLTLRNATVDDAPDIARVQIATWRAAYAGLVPAAHLDGLSVQRRAVVWRQLLSEDRGLRSDGVGLDAPASQELSATWVATHGRGRVIGFADVGPSRDTDAVGRVGELRAIYVLERYWGRGVGHALHEESVEWLRQHRYPMASLWVLEGNDQARRFYEGHGWRLEGTAASLILAGEEVTEIRYQLDLGRPLEPSQPPPLTGPVGGS